MIDGGASVPGLVDSERGLCAQPDWPQGVPRIKAAHGGWRLSRKASVSITGLVHPCYQDSMKFCSFTKLQQGIDRKAVTTYLGCAQTMY